MLVREHAAAGAAIRRRTGTKWRVHERRSIGSRVAASPRRTVFHLRRVLAKGIGLGSTELGPLLHLSKSALAGKFMFLGRHFNIILREAERAMLCKECAVASIQDVQIRIGKLRILIDVDSTITMANVLGHDGRAVSRVLAVQDQCRPGFGFSEELGGKLLLVIVVESTIDVASLVFILEATVNDHDVVEETVVLAVHYFQQCVLLNAR